MPSRLIYVGDRETGEGLQKGRLGSSGNSCSESDSLMRCDQFLKASTTASKPSYCRSKQDAPLEPSVPSGKADIAQ